MERTRLVWQEREQFAGTDRAGHRLVPASEEGGKGVSPIDALLLAVAGCTAVGVLRIMSKKRQPLAGLEVEVSADREPQPPNRFRTLGLHFLARGPGIGARDLEQAIELADRKYCAVSASLRPQVTITTSFEIAAAAWDRRIPLPQLVGAAVVPFSIPGGCGNDPGTGPRHRCRVREDGLAITGPRDR